MNLPYIKVTARAEPNYCSNNCFDVILTVNIGKEQFTNIQTIWNEYAKAQILDEVIDRTVESLKRFMKDKYAEQERNEKISYTESK